MEYKEIPEPEGLNEMLNKLPTSKEIKELSKHGLTNMDFTTSEHMAGFHDKVQEGCYECHRENRLVLSKKTVCHYPTCDGRTDVDSR